MIESLGYGLSTLAAYGFLGLMSLPLYCVLTVPGVVACLAVRQWGGRRYWCRACLLTISASLFFSPTIIPGFHAILIVPVIYPLTLAAERREGDWVSLLLGVMALTWLSWRYSIREAANARPKSGLERVWRRA